MCYAPPWRPYRARRLSDELAGVIDSAKRGAHHLGALGELPGQPVNNALWMRQGLYRMVAVESAIERFGHAID
jgi:hypothetical protein